MRLLHAAGIVGAYLLAERPSERPWQGLYADGIATLDFERGKASHILE